MIKKALNGEDLTVYGTGEYIRDYIYIDDVVFAFLSAPLYIKHSKGKHFVLGSGEGTTIHDAITLVGELVSLQTGNKVVVNNVELPSGLLQIEFRNFIADIRSLKQMEVINVQHSLENGIKETSKYFA